MSNMRIQNGDWWPSPFENEDFLDTELVHVYQLHSADFIFFPINGKEVLCHVELLEPERIFLRHKQTIISISRSSSTQVKRVVSIKRKDIVFTPGSLYDVQAAFHLRESKKIARIFHKNRIRYAFLKGAPLYVSLQYHPNRILSDVDILIDPASLNKVTSLLKKNGFTEKPVRPASAPTHDFKKKQSKTEFVIDLHTEPVFLMSRGNDWSYYPPILRRKMTDEFLKLRRRKNIQQTPFFFLSPLHQILYLSLHFYHHNCQGSSRLISLIYILQRAEKNNKTFWKKLSHIILSYHLEAFVYPVFLMLKELGQLNIPKRFLGSIYSPRSFLLYRTNLFGSLFNEDGRRVAGIRRFLLMFVLAPVPFGQKIKGVFIGLIERFNFLLTRESESYAS